MGETFEKLDKKKTEWQTLLADDSYAVLFKEATEPAGTSTLNDEKRNGTFVCAACYLPLFESTAKYNSGTGWPSFSMQFLATWAQKQTLSCCCLVLSTTVRGVGDIRAMSSRTDLNRRDSATVTMVSR